MSDAQVQDYFGNRVPNVHWILGQCERKALEEGKEVAVPSGAPGRAVSENGRLCHGDGPPGTRHRRQTARQTGLSPRQTALMLTTPSSASLVLSAAFAALRGGNHRRRGSIQRVVFRGRAPVWRPLAGFSTSGCTSRSAFAGEPYRL